MAAYDVTDGLMSDGLALCTSAPLLSREENPITGTGSLLISEVILLNARPDSHPLAETRLLGIGRWTCWSARLAMGAMAMGSGTKCVPSPHNAAHSHLLLNALSTYGHLVLRLIKTQRTPCALQIGPRIGHLPSTTSCAMVGCAIMCMSYVICHAACRTSCTCTCTRHKGRREGDNQQRRGSEGNKTKGKNAHKREWGPNNRAQREEEPRQRQKKSKKRGRGDHKERAPAPKNTRRKGHSGGAE
jgi:hypothetical protein